MVKPKVNKSSKRAKNKGEVNSLNRTALYIGSGIAVVVLIIMALSFFKL